MQTQPPFKYAQGAMAGVLVNKQTGAWSYFAEEDQAKSIYSSVRAIAPDAVLTISDDWSGGFVPSGDPNPANAHVFLISGNVPQSDGSYAPILEFAGYLYDRASVPSIVDTRPLPKNGVKLAYSESNQGLVWVAA